MTDNEKRKCPGCSSEDIFETEWVAWESEGVDAVLIKKGVILKDMEKPSCLVCLSCGLVSNFLNQTQIGKIRTAKSEKKA
ncbi:MAG: hypothetical protein K8F91_14500 [Candidatus Obscuribacterales bacterium]|nr:hypothetical protein [Candidatus Obscuribacterales bacterium]